MSDFRYYQEEVEKLVLTHGRDRLAENALGLAGEAGEVAEKIKKFFRDNKLDHQAVSKEIGDVLFYCAALAGALDLSFEAIAKDNLNKLWDRQARGKLQGEGDNR